MIEIEDKIVSTELLTEPFCCDPARCKGMCCVEGDAGAPLEIEEAERLEQKEQAIVRRLAQSNNHWSDVFFITLSRNFGFGLNGDAFEMWATRLPFRAVDKHRDNLFQVEAFFFGQAGLLDGEDASDEYFRKLQQE